MGSATGRAPVGQNGLGWYVYGVVDAGEAQRELAPPTSVEPAHRVTLVREGTLAAVASKVPLEVFTEEGLRETLSDPAWLEPRIRAHEQVLEAALAVTSVVPFRFCTLFRSDDALRAFLGERRNELREALRSVEGKIEIGVKGFLSGDRFAESFAERDEAARGLRERAASAQGGRAYLERRRLEQLLAREVERFKADAAHDIHNRLLASANDGVLNPTQSREVSGREDEMFMNAAYLVDRGQAFEPEVEALASEYQERGVTLERTGPWPPYNFVPRALVEA